MPHVPTVLAFAHDHDRRRCHFQGHADAGMGRRMRCDQEGMAAQHHARADDERQWQGGCSVATDGPRRSGGGSWRRRCRGVRRSRGR